MLKAKMVEPTETPLPLKIPRYSISSLASSIHYNCKKHIYLLSKSKQELNTYTEKPDESIKEAHLTRGNDFEQNLYERHRSIMVDHTNSADFKKVLQEAEPGTYLYQLKCWLPDSFYTDIIHNADAYRINNFIPDFLYIRQDPVTHMRKILIIDAKSSKEMSKSHQFQVTSYAFFLSYLIKDIRNLEVDDMGGVWLPSNLDAPVTFRIDFVLNKIKYIYIDTLVSISQDPDPEWVLGRKCSTCQFLKRCKEDAVGTVRSIPYMNEEKANRLKEDGMLDIEDLSELLQTLNISKMQEVDEGEDADRYATGYEDYVNAYSDKKPKFMGYASALTAKEIDHAVYMYLQMDTYSQRPFVYAMKVVNIENNCTFKEYTFAIDYTLHLEDELASYSKFVDKFVKDLTEMLHTLDELSSRCIFYVYTVQEKKIVQDFLYNLIQSEGKDLITLSSERKQEMMVDAMRCLVVLFQDTELLGLPGIVHYPDMDDLVKTVSIGRFCSIEELLQQNIALGVSGYYSLADVVEWMTNDAASDGVDNNTVYTQWKTPSQDSTCTTSKLVLQRFTMLQEIMATYWDLANEYMRHTQTDLFPLICKPFRWPAVQTYRHQTLAKLVFFKQLECIKSCDEIRMDRIHDLSKLEHSSNETSVGGLVLEYRKRIEGQSAFNHRLIFTVSSFLNGPHVQQKLDRLTIDTFKQYILVPDTREGIIETIKYPDLVYAQATTFQKKGIRCVDVLSIENEEIHLCGNAVSPSVKRWRLFRRFTDFTSERCITALKSIDLNDDLTDMMELIRDPNAWADKNVTDDINFHSNDAAIQIRDQFAMSPSQKDISANIFKKRLQIIWGPPGSGKTEFLALFINWYIKCLTDQDSKKELIIGVTAFTRDAIFNLLKRIEKIQSHHGFDDLFSIVYVSNQPHSQFDAAKSRMINTSWDKSITVINKLKKATQIKIYVVGSTVWGWDRIRTKWKTFKGCNLLIMDESTQLLVSDALLGIACLSKPNGKLIIAGDHMQLGPIIKNDYSVFARLDEPLLYGSIQQCLMRTSDNHAIPTREFLLQKGALHDFGPNTLQLKDNWRMNEELNEFFQQVYGPDYTSRYPHLKLNLDWQSMDGFDLVKSVLEPSQAISLVKLKSLGGSTFDAVETEAGIVQQLVEAYLASNTDTTINRDPQVMVVTPHHQQRVAIQRRISSKAIPVDTVEKMQGQECDLIIACFSCTNHKRGNDFLRDFRRWNVALSRARCKVVILTVDELINPKENFLDSFSHTLEPTDGFALLCLLQQWTEKKNSTWDWVIDE